MAAHCGVNRRGRGNTGKGFRFYRRDENLASGWFSKCDDWSVREGWGWRTAGAAQSAWNGSIWSSNAIETSINAQIWAGLGDQVDGVYVPICDTATDWNPNCAADDVDHVLCAALGVQSEPATSSDNVLLIGGPGSGKTTLGQMLSQFGFFHISGGDVFRALNEQADFQPLTSPKVFAVISRVVSKVQRAFVSFDGFLPKDFDDFEKQIGPISLIVELRCSEQTLLDRACSRESRRHDVGKSAEQRVSKYFSTRQQARTEEALASYDSRLVTIDVDASLQEVKQQLFECVRAAIPTIGEPDARSPSPNGASELSGAFWRREAAECFAAVPRAHNTSCEWRMDPGDGVVYTFKELSLYYRAQCYSDGEIRRYWKGCVRIPGRHVCAA